MGGPGRRPGTDIPLDRLDAEVAGFAEAGSDASTVAALLQTHGVDAHMGVAEDVNQLALRVQLGSACVCAVNGGALDGSPDPDDFNAADRFVVVTGTARDRSTGELLGFFVNDAGTGDAGKFVPADDMRRAWERATGPDGLGTVVTVTPR